MTQHNDGQIHRGSLPSALHEMHQKQADNARTHLIHDYGNAGAQLLFQNYNQTALVKGVLLQRAEMTVADTLFDANGYLAGKIDLGRLGVSAEHIAQIGQLQAEELSRGGFAGRFASPAASHVQQAAQSDGTRGTGR